MRSTSIPQPADNPPSTPSSDGSTAAVEADTATTAATTPHDSDVVGGRRDRIGRLVDIDPLEVVGDIVELAGPDGERLAQQQARVLWEVTQWVAQNRSAPGQPTAA